MLAQSSAHAPLWLGPLCLIITKLATAYAVRLLAGAAGVPKHVWELLDSLDALFAAAQDEEPAPRR